MKFKYLICFKLFAKILFLTGLTHSFVSAMLISQSCHAMDKYQPASESSFQYFVSEEGKRVNLHASDYKQVEISIVEQFKQKLEESTSPEKDEVIAKGLVKIIKVQHYRLLLADRSSCFAVTNTSIPASNDLDAIIFHCLYEGKFLGFGRNRTSKVLVKKLKWLDRNNNPTATCPKVFRIKWEEARKGKYRI